MYAHIERAYSYGSRTEITRSGATPLKVHWWAQRATEATSVWPMFDHVPRGTSVRPVAHSIDEPPVFSTCRYRMCGITLPSAPLCFLHREQQRVPQWWSAQNSPSTLRVAGTG